ERLLEQLLRRAVDLPDRGLQVVAGARQVVTLRLQELETLAFFGMLLDREHVDRTEPLDVGTDRLQLRTQYVGVAIDDLRLLQQVLECAAPLCLQPLAHAALGSL